ncbi:MAG: biopolymer transport protein ExbD [Marinobacter sp. T13-3]|nr:MAG: biopolymer transport protein ExbD [Marinobacter sp. T13-3]
MNELVPPPGTSGKGLLDRVEDALLPLINLVFLLLMFFIVAGQLANDPLPDLPGTTQLEKERSPEADLMVKADGSWQVDGKSRQADTLLAALDDPGEDASLRIAADEGLTMADLETLLRLLEQGGYTEVVLLTEPGS